MKCTSGKWIPIYVMTCTIVILFHDMNQRLEKLKKMDPESKIYRWKQGVIKV